MPLSDFLGGFVPSLPVVPTATIWDTERPIGWIGTIEKGVPPFDLTAELAELREHFAVKCFIKHDEVTIYVDECDSGKLGSLLNEQ
jgi:hypothetical protein